VNLCLELNECSFHGNSQHRCSYFS
jgi:hypothetical protein